MALGITSMIFSEHQVRLWSIKISTQHKIKIRILTILFRSFFIILSRCRTITFLISFCQEKTLVKLYIFQFWMKKLNKQRRKLLKYCRNKSSQNMWKKWILQKWFRLKKLLPLYTYSTSRKNKRTLGKSICRISI